VWALRLSVRVSNFFACPTDPSACVTFRPPRDR